MFEKKFRFAALVLITCLGNMNVTAQFYYKDVWYPQQLHKEMDMLKAEKVKAVSVKSFDSNGEPSEGFFCEKRINKNYTSSQTITKSTVTSQSLLSSYFNAKELLIKTADSSEAALNLTEYVYNNNDQVAAVNTLTKAYDDANAINENHQYIFDPGGRLQQMIRKKNNADYSTINFKVDEKGNVIEEQEILKNGQSTKYFYYYDDKNNLTDVVHYNDRAKRLLPDYMYEYNALGQIKQMTTIEEGGGYYIWRYTYNDQKLRDTEKCFSKEKKLLGSVQYSYK